MKPDFFVSSPTGKTLIQYKIPSLRTPALKDTISWSRGSLHRKSCTYKRILNFFVHPHLRNWCWKPFSGMLLLFVIIIYYYCCCCRWRYLLLRLLVLRSFISSLLQSATAYFITKYYGLLLQSATIVITMCDRYYKVQQFWPLWRGSTRCIRSVRQRNGVNGC